MVGGRRGQPPAPGPQPPASLPGGDFCFQDPRLPGLHSRRSCMGHLCLLSPPQPTHPSRGGSGQSGAPLPHQPLAAGRACPAPERRVTGKEESEAARQLLTTGPHEGGASGLRRSGDPGRASSPPPFITRGGGSSPPPRRAPLRVPLPPGAASGQSLCVLSSIFLKTHQRRNLSLPGFYNLIWVEWF